jgi:GNAT superfamily N-acetyltransferase
MRIEIRALRPDDQADLIAAVGRTSADSLYRRFFGFKRGFTDGEVAFYLNIDFVSHVALIVLADDGAKSKILGGGRYIVVRPGEAEVAFMVVDHYQGQGIGPLLLQHLGRIARGAGLERLVAEVLTENLPMLKVFQRSGLPLQTKPAPGLMHVSLSLL